jgi:hypothetical protein
MTKPFEQRRRQQFLLPAYYENIRRILDTWNQDLLANLGRSELGIENISLEAAQLANNRFELLSLRYTAGEPIETLRDALTDVVEAYEHYQKALADFEQIPEIAPLGMGRIDDYERCMQLIGLCYLLHRRDLLPRIAALQDPGYVGEDALYEDLLSYELPDRIETDEMLHIDLYDPLLGVMYADTDEESAQLLDEYVNNWYPAFKYAPWHDGHLRINGTDGDYFGYWAFEAGAVAYLCNIDDGRVTHMVYPKDLVAWARAHADEYSNEGSGGVAKSRSNVPAGQPCPEAGWWFTPAKADSRRYFKQGDPMPSLGGDYGQTFWQWAPDQSAPTL